MMRYLIALLAVAGVVVSSLALRIHYSTDTAPCSISEKWDCGIVNHSPYAELWHVPVAGLGIAGYLLILGLAMARRHTLLALTSVAAVCFALHLTWIEGYVLQVWCKYCVISQCIVAVITVLSLLWLAVNSYKNGTEKLIR